MNSLGTDDSTSQQHFGTIELFNYVYQRLYGVWSEGRILHKIFQKCYRLLPKDCYCGSTNYLKQHTIEPNLFEMYLSETTSQLPVHLFR